MCYIHRILFSSVFTERSTVIHIRDVKHLHPLHINCRFAYLQQKEAAEMEYERVADEPIEI